MIITTTVGVLIFGMLKKFGIVEHVDPRKIAKFICGAILIFGLLLMSIPIIQRIFPMGEYHINPVVKKKIESLMLDNQRNGKIAENAFSRDTLSQSNDSLQHVFNFLPRQENGHFVESHAFNGGTHSLTLALQLYHNWTGILIEANLQLFEDMLKIHREAFAINADLTDFSHSVQCNDGINCFALHDIILASNLTTVDLMLLRGHKGPEVLSIFELMSWEAVNILCIIFDDREFSSNGNGVKTFDREIMVQVQKVLRTQGFEKYISRWTEHLHLYKK